MGFLDSIERGLEKAVNGAFAKTFRSGVEPVEIASALKRELDTQATVVSRDRILVPNRLTVRLAPADFQRLRRLGDSLLDELTGTVQTHARQSGYSFPGALDLGLEPDEGMTTGMLEIGSDSEAGEVVWTAVVDIKGKRHRLRRGRTVIGRGSDADITIDDAGASRKHVEIIWDGTRSEVSDLGSTNGTTLNGRRLKRALLEPDSIIDIGATRIVYRLLAQSKEQA